MVVQLDYAIRINVLFPIKKKIVQETGEVICFDSFDKGENLGLLYMKE